MTSLSIGNLDAEVVRNPDQNLNAIRAASGKIVVWSDDEAQRDILRQIEIPQEYVGIRLRDSGMRPVKLSADEVGVTIALWPWPRSPFLIWDSSGWCAIPSNGAVGQPIPSDEGCYFGPDGFGPQNPARILAKLEKSAAWQLTPMSTIVPPEIIILGVSRGQAIFYSAPERMLFAANVSPGSISLSGDHASWIRSAQSIAQVPGPIANGLEGAVNRFFSSTVRAILTPQFGDVLCWRF